MVVEKDQIMDGTITGITTFGAFIKLDEKTTGLVHISEVADSFVKDINTIYKLGDVVKVKVLKIDDKGKLVLSIKKAVEGGGTFKPRDRDGDYRPPNRDFRDREPRRTGSSFDSDTKVDPFEDKLAKFMKDSEEIQLDSKRSKDLARKRKKSK